jgi:hypothetical protein
MTEKVKLSLCEKIDRARDGRSQKSIVKKMIQVGLEMDEVRFSTKKKANSFSEEEVKALSKILNTDLS